MWTSPSNHVITTDRTTPSDAARNLATLHNFKPDLVKLIKGITLKINPGEKIAIVGATGSGKSTIINLISRFYEIDSGKIYVDGFSLNDIEISSLRTNIGIVLQEVFLYADSIYNNITLFDKSFKKSDVINSAKEIGVHDFIMTLPKGYEFNIQERGQMLSAGQRHLIAFLAYLFLLFSRIFLR